MRFFDSGFAFAQNDKERCALRFLKAAKAQKKRCRMFKLRPSVAKGLPEGVLLYIEGRSLNRIKGTQNNRKASESPKLFYINQLNF